ncbi:PQQ-dependent sugar dehydrogenase [Candidatus Parcubacteria bacterium]|nr:PQQ-dependent sugar dehydrogenase [Candidatus Parcubacteria bacterium]
MAAKTESRIIRKTVLTVTVTLLLSILIPSAHADMVSNLSLYWTLDQGSGSIATDSTSNANNGTLFVSPVWNTTGKLGGSLTFDTTNDYVSAADSNTLDLTVGTYSAWVNPSAAGWGGIIDKGIDSDLANNYAMEINPSRQIQCTISNNTSFNAVTSSAILPLNTWSHVACVWNGTTLKVYVNGIESGSVAETVTPVGNSLPFQIGRWGASDYFRGMLDEVRVYNRVLSATDITELFNFGNTPVPPPSTPTGLSASAISSSQINLSWTDTSADELGFRIERKTGASGVYGEIATVGANIASYQNISGLSASTTYAYRVRSYNNGGNSAYSNEATSTTRAAVGDTTPPTVTLTAPLNSTIVSGTNTLVTATASDNVGVVGVQFLLDGTNLGAEDTSSPYSMTWNTTTATNGAHTVSARARDTAGNATVSVVANVNVDNQAPTGTIAINNGASATNNRNAILNLTATDTLSAVTQMRFSNTGSSYSTAEAYATTKAWTLATGTGTKTVFVQFMDARGNWSVGFSDTIVMDTTSPTISLVSVTNITSNSATVNWTTSEPASSRVDYGVTTSYGSQTSLDNTLLTTHSVVVTGLNSGTLYNYRPRSIDAAGNEKLGNNATFTTSTSSDTVPPSTPTGLSATVASSTQINLAWNASTDNVAVSTYILYRNGSQIISQSTRTYSDTGLIPNTSYTYAVKARDTSGNVSATSSPITATTSAPALSISNIITSGITTSNATINWTTSTSSTSQVNYGVNSNYGLSSQLDSNPVTQHSQTLSSLNPNTTYHYQVRSVDSFGTQAQSNDLSFTTQDVSTSTPGTFQNEIITSNLNLPVQIQFLPNGNLLILELGGKIWILRAGASQVDPIPFLELTNVGTTNGYQGLFDITLDPDFSNNHYYYVFYTLSNPNVDRVSRFTATNDLFGTVAGSEFVIYQDTQDAGPDHHGGALNFASDGKLYITTGENFAAERAQDMTSTEGKILRLNKDGTVPTDNPFYDGAGPNADGIWALGLRNPYRAWIDPTDGKFYIGDVGGNDYSTAIEEVDMGVRGANYGWANCEANCQTPPYTQPLYYYPHDGRDASITGGFVYHGTQFPATYRGSYFFADYAQNWIKRLTFDTNGNVSGVINFEPPTGIPDGPYGDIVALKEGPDGALYYVDIGFNDTCPTCQSVSKIRRIKFISNDLPPVAVSSANLIQSSSTPFTVNFSSTGSSDPDGNTLTYLWDFGDNTATSTLANPSHTYTQTGQFSARLTVSDGMSSTTATPIVITIGNSPVITLSSPIDGSLFRAGDVINFSADATDTEDGALPASAFTWNIDFLHEGHVHPALPTVGSKSGTFQIPTSGHDFHGNTRYRFTVTVTDSDGLKSSASVIIYPDKVNLTLDTVPSGIGLTLDGLAITTPTVYDTLIGYNHVVNAPTTTQGANTFNFANWSDGGTQQHTVVVPSSPLTLTATYSQVQSPIPPGLAAAFNLNQGSGAVATDSTLNANIGTLTNGPVWSLSGKYGGAINFDGLDDYISVPDSNSLDLSASGTISAWINPIGVGWRSVFGKGTIGDISNSYAMELSSNSAVQCTIGNNISYNFVLSSTSLAPNTWSHVACVWNGTTFSVYINGVLNNSAVQNVTPYNNTSPLQFGRWATTDYFHGSLDEMRIYNRALTASEVQTDMNTPL